MEKTNFSICRFIVIALLSFRIVGNSYAQNADINLLKNINLHRNKSLDGVTVSLTNSVYPIAGVVPVGELVVGYIKHDSALITSGWSSVAALGVNFVVTFGLKYAVDRPRPYATYSFIAPYQHDTDPSFPSGHTSFSFCTATSLYLAFPRWYVAVPAYAWAAGVGYSRMALGMHYPTDVLAGAVIGAGSSYLSFKGNEWLHNRRKHKTAKHEL